MRFLAAAHRSPDTIRTRWYQITRFSRLVDKPIESVGPADVVAVLASIDGLSAKKGTRAAVKGFYEWARDMEYLVTETPLMGVPTYREGQPVKPVCPELNVNRGITAEDLDVRICCMLAAWMGLRRAEISWAHAGQLEETNEGMIMHVWGKGAKPRDLPVPDGLAVLLAEQVSTVGWLFPSTRSLGNHRGVDWVGNRIKQGTGGWPAHSLRRRFATVAYYRNGCDILSVSRLLGHSDVRTTMRYIGIVPGSGRSIVESASYMDLMAPQAGFPVPDDQTVTRLA
ncbi:tyrosine-type recombinase/integrase [Bifidobacterium simiarum]|uniref:tyrosine-type recombinase/integrase n=1 Tax=Bifidobacterium simiarum TaxID=2045441 RepID=UPI001BDD9950|nr:site-specific integrase [Bifidobacterium simiarum]MBT1165175.1 site-specific integrase [Bifidobacterium simiarum]